MINMSENEIIKRLVEINKEIEKLQNERIDLHNTLFTLRYNESHGWK